MSLWQQVNTCAAIVPRSDKLGRNKGVFYKIACDRFGMIVEQIWAQMSRGSSGLRLKQMRPKMPASSQR